MRRFLVWLGVIVFAALAAGAVYVYTGIQDVRVEQVSEDVFVLSGWGGNVAVLRTDRGAVIVDTMTFRTQGQQIREQAEALVGGPVVAVVNTHYHGDHTHGNPAFPAGTRMLSTSRTRDHLRNLDADAWAGPNAETLPNEFVDDAQELSFGDKTVLLVHPGRGHTDGDLVALFVEDRVLVTGDLLFAGRYPRIDLVAGGSVREWIPTIDGMLELDFDRVIPGHGPVTDAAGLRAFQDFLRELWDVGRDAAARGLSLEEAQQQARFTTDAGFSTIGVPLLFRIDRHSAVAEAWTEASGRVEGGSQ